MILVIFILLIITASVIFLFNVLYRTRVICAERKINNSPSGPLRLLLMINMLFTLFCTVFILILFFLFYAKILPWI
jgi:hypothetical protein